MSTSATEVLLRGQALVERKRELLNRWACDVPDCDGMPHEGWTHRHARASQREPDDYAVWLLLTGRGFGKTRTGAETTKKWGTGTRRQHIAVIGRTERETRNICFEGPGGLLSVIRPHLIAGGLRNGYHKSQGDLYLTLTNGTVYRGFSAEKADAIRGYAFDGSWLDEYASWAMNNALECWDNLWFALREAKYPRVVVTTTPRNLLHVKQVISEADHITRGTMLDNRANLSERAIAKIMRKYHGTRIGRQELYGELVEDVEGALWTWAMIENHRYTGRLEDLLPKLWRIIVGVDPAGTNHNKSDETGIVVCGVAGPRRHPEFYVLEDVSGRYSPDQWAKLAVTMYDKWSADAIAAEQQNGWDMVNATLHHQDQRVRIIKCQATRGKHLRAEPIAALYEQGRVHHLASGVGSLQNLEDQMTSWTPFDTDLSPDRLDALVWAATELSAGPGTQASFGGAAAAATSLAPGGGAVIRRPQ